MTEPTRNAPPWVTWVLIVVGVLFLVAGLVYFARPAAELPSFFPGHDTALHTKHIKHGIAMIGLAVIAWVGAWLTTGTKPTSPDLST
ncbi:MAG TPA: hypothetical protein VIM19_16805 [Actinomycetes bacterium]